MPPLLEKFPPPPPTFKETADRIPSITHGSPDQLASKEREEMANEVRLEMGQKKRERMEREFQNLKKVVEDREESALCVKNQRRKLRRR